MYASYGVGDLLKQSGVVALLSTGVMFGQYGYYNLSAKGRTSSSVFFKFLAFIFEGYVFVLMGFGLFKIGDQGDSTLVNDAYSLKLLFS
jgi:NhaP-type Na+/H+ or K+/H+ antiporter